MKLPADNFCFPIRITIGTASGSGFLIRNNQDIYLITAKHVIYKAAKNQKIPEFHNEKIQLCCYVMEEEGMPPKANIYEIDLPIFQKEENIKFHPEVDLVALRIGVKETSTVGKGRLDFVNGFRVLQKNSKGSLIAKILGSSRKFEEVGVSNDVYVLGYPASLSAPEEGQLDYNSPLVRKGIVGGKNLNNKTLILDCPVYGGNSGGMVLEAERITPNETALYLIGIVTQFVPYIDEWQNTKMPSLRNVNMHNSGYSVALPVDYIFDLVKEFKTYTL